MKNWTNIVSEIFRLLVVLIVSVFVLGWLISLTGCEKSVEVEDQKGLSMIYPTIAVQSPDSYHFICDCDNFVNSPRVYVHEAGEWYDIASKRGKIKFSHIRYTIWNSDTTWTLLQHNTDEKWGRMTFCATIEGYEDGLCDFMQPCSIYTFNFKAEAWGTEINLNTGTGTKAITHKGITTRVYSSDDIPNGSCP